ncbi:hypothetical protein B7463_g4239, partial [Scytalidium lignicola]
MATCSIQDNSFGPVIDGCRANFDFTLLFEQSIFSIGPAALLLLFAPPRFAKLLRSTKKTSRFSLAKTITCLLLLGVQLGLLTCWSMNRVTNVTVPAAVLSFLAAIAVLALSRLEDSRTVRPSSLLNIYLLISLVFDAVQVRTLYLRHDDPPILGLFTADVTLKALLLFLEGRSKRRYLKSPYNEYPPEAISGILNRSFFWWINPILATGFRKILTLDDLWKSDPALLSAPLCEQMIKSWDKYQYSGKWALVKALAYCLRWPLASIIFPRLCLIGFNYAQPFLISTAINYISEKSSEQNKTHGYGLIAATGLVYLGIAKHAGVYDESSSLTLMSTDIDRIVLSMEATCEAWARVIEISIGIWLLARQLGWVCVAPIIITVGSMYGATKIAAKIGPRQRDWIKAIQRRVGMTSSMLGSMKSVKMMGLSKILTDSLQSQRIQELEMSKKFRLMSLWRLLLSFLPPTLGPLAVFVIFSIQASTKGLDTLTASQAFSSLAIITLITDPATDLLRSLPQAAMATGCLSRIQKFLLSAPLEDYRSLPNAVPKDLVGEIMSGGGIELQSLSKNSSSEFAVSLHRCSIRPAPEAPIALHDINFEVAKGSLTMVIGVIGSGKSTLIKTIVGELPCDRGTITMTEQSTAYCSQTPWLPNSTVRNIINGYTTNDDPRWYRTVVYACAFDEDILEFPDQDDSIIGSRGITLSGGQKQRLALARAVYSRRSIIALDDVLSAVDPRTETLIVERLLGKSGLFKKLGTTVILATHAIRHLHLADTIIVLGADGRITENGSIDFLRSQSGFVSRLISHPEILQSKQDTEQRNATETSSDPKPRRETIRHEQLPDPTRQIGDISTYKYYFNSIGWKLVFINVSSAFIFALGLRFPSVWLNLYAEGYITSLPLFACIYALCAVIALGAVTLFLYSLYMKVIPKSGARLHQILLQSVMSAPQSFFDTTDSGITLNRFSQDMTLVDGNLPNSAVMCQAYLWQCLAGFALIATGSSYVALTCPLLIIAVYFLQMFYLRTSRQIRFLDLECKSPLYTHFSETLEGLSTIRSFGWQKHFIDQNLQHLDTSQRPYYLLYCIQRWFNLVLQLLVGLLATIVVALATNLTGSTSGGRLGISLSAVVTFSSSLASFIMYWTQLETSLGAITRIKGFEEGTADENREEETFVPGDEWPTRGLIELSGISASYGSNSPALSDISFTVKPGEKIGICGRTGSGKSSLLSILVRILEIDSGTVSIDGLDLQILPREIIRSRLITIPQDPFFLAGSVRLNADPTLSTTEPAIITALTKVGLWDIIEARGGLDADMTTNPLSQGQQQIFCLARAMLQTGSRILLLDEATSNVDAETDQAIQRIIREEFKHHTILTVAHRLDTILDSDKIAVLEDGRLVEFDSPGNLLARDSVFRRLKSMAG